MKIQILVNQIGDADSIFIGLTDEKRSLVILLDGGRKMDTEKLKVNLAAFLTAYDKSSPDIVIASHYDDDHISGILPLIAPFESSVQQLWSFDTTNLTAFIINEKNESILPSENDMAAGAEYFINTPEIESLIEGIQSEQNLLKYAASKKIKTIQPVANECSLDGWPEIAILSPTRSYYNSLFPNNLSSAEMFINVDEIKTGAGTEAKEPCECLTLKKSPVSRVNLNSCILKITVAGRAFLFAADAGIDSFYNIENYRNELKDLFWLKVPHHGSQNNLNKELIELMSPKHAVISGDKYVSQEIVRCLENVGAKVFTTQSGDIKDTFEWYD